MSEHGHRRAHAGMLAAATTIWNDLQAHHILHALLNCGSTDKANPEYHSSKGMFVTSKHQSLPRYRRPVLQDRTLYLQTKVVATKSTLVP